MGPLRSWRTLVLVALAAGFGFLWARAHGAPRLAQQLASIGDDPLDARGGVVLDLAAAPDAPTPERDRAIALVERRLERFGDASFAPHGDGVRATMLGVDPDRAAALAWAASLGGKLELAIVREGGPLNEAIMRLRDRPLAPDVRVELDSWTAEDSDVHHRIPYLTARDPAELRRVVAGLPAADGERVVLEHVTPEPNARDTRPYWRTYVIGDEWTINDALTDATPTWDPNTNKPIVEIEFDRDGGRRFGELTSAHVGDKIAIVLDDEVTSAPIVNGPIRGGRAIITMGGSDEQHMQDEADALVTAIHAGHALPIAVHAEIVARTHAAALRVALAQLLTALAAALFVLAIAWPLARWSALGRAPVSSDRATSPRVGALVPRVLVTLVVPAALWALRGVTAPGIDTAVASKRLGVSLLALGVAPVLLAVLAIELVALLLPAWRVRRRAGGDARAPLVLATVAVAAAIAVIEGWLRADFLSRIVLDDPAVAPDARWEVAAAMAGGVMLYALGAAAIDRWGLGRGWSAMIGLDLILRVVGEDRATTWTGWLPAVPIAALAIVAARTRVRDDGGGVRLPIGGFLGAAAVPLFVVGIWAPLQLVPALRASELFGALGRAELAIPIAMTIAAAFALAGTRRLAGADRVRAIALDVAIAAGFAGLPLALGLRAGAACTAALLAAACADVLADARARARGAWTVIAVVPDVAAADALLDDDGAPRIARGLHVRALLGPAAPMIALEVLEAQTPAQQALEASLAPARLVAD